MRSITKLYICIIALALFASCQKTWEEPPMSSNEANIGANFTIKKAQRIKKNDTPFDSLQRHFRDPYYIKAMVIANDEQKNFENTLVLQDATGGIELKLQSHGLYTKYPVGQEVYVSLKSLVIGKDHGMFQIGWSNSEGNIYGLAPLFFDISITKDGYPKTPTFLNNNDIDADATQNLNESYGRLVRLEGCHFDEISWGQALAGETAGNHRFTTTINGQEAEFILHTSENATFKHTLVPESSCTIFGILRRYENTMQLVLRSADDIQLQN